MLNIGGGHGLPAPVPTAMAAAYLGPLIYVDQTILHSRFKPGDRSRHLTVVATAVAVPPKPMPCHPWSGPRVDMETLLDAGRSRDSATNTGHWIQGRRGHFQWVHLVSGTCFKGTYDGKFQSNSHFWNSLTLTSIRTDTHLFLKISAQAPILSDRQSLTTGAYQNADLELFSFVCFKSSKKQNTLRFLTGTVFLGRMSAKSTSPIVREHLRSTNTEQFTNIFIFVWHEIISAPIVTPEQTVSRHGPVQI